MKYESYESSNGWYSHRLYLFKELVSLNENASILEFGVGDGSSILIHDYCKENKNAQAIAFETDKSWFLKMKDQYELENYRFVFLESWSDLQQHLENKIYDLVFVDQSPWEARIESIDLIKDKSRTVMVHDYDYYNKDLLQIKGKVSGTSQNIYVNDENSFWWKNYSNLFSIEDYYEKLPPTLIMRSKNDNF
jgi:hypothetical protein